MSESNSSNREIVQYCLNNGAMLEQMTTTAIARHLKLKFPVTAKEDPMAIVNALGIWCKEHRPEIACFRGR